MSLRRFAFCRAAAGLCFALLFGFFAVSAVQAQQAGDAFTVQGVPVDVTAATAMAARDAAMISGQRKAFDLLMARLVPESDRGRLPLLSDQEILDLVADVGVDRENMSEVRYLAELTVRFRPEAVRKVMQGGGVAYAEWRNAPIIVLPVWPSVIESEEVAADNPWRQAWLSPATQGIAVFSVASPSQTDQAGGALAGASQEEIERYAADIGAKDMIVSRVRIGEQGGKIVLSVKTDAVGAYAARLQGERSYQGEIAEGQGPLLEKAAGELAAIVNESFKGSNALRQGKPSALTVTAPLRQGLADWVAMREKLSRAAAVRGYELNALTKSRAALTLHYVGGQEQLESNLVQNGLVLMWSEDHWELANAGR